jgi:hypothetical protein
MKPAPQHRSLTRPTEGKLILCAAELYFDLFKKERFPRYVRAVPAENSEGREKPGDLLGDP